MFCTVSARVAHRYVLDKIADDRLKIYVVWGPYKEREKEEDARWAAAFVPDPRATHFWTETPAPGNLFNEVLKPLGLGPLSAWDAFLVFSPETRWDDAVPTPVDFMHRGVKEKPLNGNRLFDQVSSLLAATEGKPRGPDRQ